MHPWVAVGGSGREGQQQQTGLQGSRQAVPREKALVLVLVVLQITPYQIHTVEVGLSLSTLGRAGCLTSPLCHEKVLSLVDEIPGVRALRYWSVQGPGCI